MPSWLIPGLITNLIAMGIGFCGRHLWDWMFSFRKSPFAGDWEGEITNNKGAVEKRDFYKIKHNRRTSELSGTINRIFPNSQTHRKWKMIGKVDGDGYVLFSFWSIVGTHKSRGCAFLKHKEDNVFEGYYLEDHKEGKIDKTPIRLVKKR